VRHNVTINSILPGPFATDRMWALTEAAAKASGRPFDEIWTERATANPAGRFGDPLEFGQLCAYLCSAQAGYITGQNILIDGGAYPGTF
jgi:3-oxoacyl-[acyl-carrier protein] reductase